MKVIFMFDHDKTAFSEWRLHLKNLLRDFSAYSAFLQFLKKQRKVVDFWSQFYK